MAKNNEWDQLPGESSKAYEAARTYFELGANRSQEAVCKELAKSRALISRWASKYDWVERARIYDNQINKVRQRSRERAEAMAEREWARRRAAQREEEYQAARKLLAKVEQMLKTLSSQ